MKSALKRLINKNKENNETSNDQINKKTDTKTIGVRRLVIILTGAITPILIHITVILVIVVIVLGPILMAKQYLEDLKNDAAIFFDKVGNVLTLKGWCSDKDNTCEKKAEQKYYERLNKVYEQYQKKNITLDTELITATVFYSDTVSDDKFNSDDDNENKDDSAIEKIKDLIDDDDIHLGDISVLASNMVSGSKVDYTKYRNYLIDTYIPKRFSDMYNDDDEKKKIADEIMSFANQDISGNDSQYASLVYEECKEVCSTDGKCYDLEEFVTRVVDHESGPMIGLTDKYAEQWKAQAVAARTYTLHKTNKCTQAIKLGNDINILDPSAARSEHDKIKDAIEETKGEILTINGEVAVGNWDSFYKGNNYHCDDEYCYATYNKVGLTWANSKQHEIKSYKKWENRFEGGHGYGLSQYGAAYLADIGWNYKDILKYFYEDGIEFSKMTTVATGRIEGTTYTSTAPVYESAAKFYSSVDYKYFLSTSAMPDPQNFGECPWFAQGRALQIVANSNMPEERKEQVLALLRATRANGGEWYSKLKNTMLNSSTDIYAAKPGSIITWASPGQYGHVGIIEAVEYDSNGRAARVLVTESWNGTGNPANASYSYSWQTIDGIRRYTGHRHSFVGYTYLLD